MESPSYVDLPTDIIMEILLRLPVKTLLRFKCVCKKWYTLIGSPSFINQHFEHESNQEKLLIWLRKPLRPLQFMFGFYVDEKYSVYKEPDPLQGLGGSEFLMGPSNGVFCVCSRPNPVFCVRSRANPGRKMALLNPAMKQFKPLPLLHQNLDPHLMFNPSSFGFGLEPVSGDYKVVWIQYLWNKDTDVPHFPPLVYVYNSGTDSWRDLEDVDLVYSMHCKHWPPLSGTCLNGVYYWLIKLERYDAASIICFDMRSEKFREVPVPDHIIISPDPYLQLVLNGDSLALLSVPYPDQTDRCIDVWVIRNERCWAKILTLSCLGDVRPFGFWKKNELILGGLTSIFSLDGSKEKLWIVETPLKMISSISFHAYKESLVSIKREGDNCKLWDTSSDVVKDFFLQS